MEVRRCYVSLLFTPSPNTAFRRRTNEEHRRLGETYRQLTTLPARKNFVKEYATRYCKLSRLPYFNLVEQIVVNLMHNLFLGQFHYPTVFFHADSG